MPYIDVIFIYCPIVTAVSAPYEVHMYKQVQQLYTFMQQSYRYLRKNPVSEFVCVSLKLVDNRTYP